MMIADRNELDELALPTAPYPCHHFRMPMLPFQVAGDLSDGACL